ncbi:MAG: Gfo/Idh/MocA family oxidoreductase [Verrucomicrobiales bacterium]
MLGQNKGDKLRVAFVGVGGIGGSHTGMAHSKGDICNCFCDVDTTRMENASKRWPKAKAYQDYREMFEKEKDNFDAVMVGVPDHHHYPATILAMQMGKHCYTQKPLTHTIWEARELLKAYEANPKLVTQMGNQGHANEGNRLMVEWVQQGKLGDIKEVHCWTNRPVWTQPRTTPEGADEIPANLNWDCWIGPAPMRKFKKDIYHAFQWRGWWDFGGGALADMACHTMDCVYWALDPGAPTKVEVIECTDMPEGNFPAKSRLKFTFPAKGDRPGFDFYWHDGGLKPDHPAHLEEGRDLPNTGALFIGSNASLMSSGDYGDSPRIIPETKMQEIGKPEKTLDRSPGHYDEWRAACLGEKPREFAKSNFSYSAPFSEVVLLGNLALRAGKGNTFGWDSANLKVTGMDELNQYVNKEYREGWKF